MKAARLLKTQAGFSLIELMIVVAIIGILASIAVPNFQKFQRRAKQSEGKGYLTSIYTAEHGFRAEWNSYAGDLVCIGFRDDQITTNGALGIAGRGHYVAGFTGAAVVNGSSCTTARFTAAPQAAAGIVIPTAVTGAVNPTAIAFTAATAGQLGGALEDRWTINNEKIVSNTQNGL